jgi:hypothetical protein
MLTVPIPNLPVNVAEKVLESLSSPTLPRGATKENISIISTNYLLHNKIIMSDQSSFMFRGTLNVAAKLARVLLIFWIGTSPVLKVPQLI